jgi:hypothetical protein
MPLLGSAAMLLSFDVEAGAIEEHDRWHTQEHLPERLSIPGFLRGTRWVASEGSPRYMVVYEVDRLETLASEGYLARLDSPTPWTQKMMPHYRGMSRGLCNILGSLGVGQGGVAGLIRFTPRATDCVRWLLEEGLPSMLEAPGIGSAHLLQGAQAAAMTNEQRIRGADRDVDCAVIAMGYDEGAVTTQSRKLGEDLAARAAGVHCATYRHAYSLSRAEIRP